MLKRPRFLILLAGGAVLAAVLMAQSARSGSSTDLRDWVGTECTVHLLVDSDPRAGRTSFRGGTNGMVHHVEDIPISVTGTVRSASDHAIVLAVDGSVAWIPRERIRLIVGWKQQTAR